MTDSIVSASARLAAGTTTAVELVEASLAAIEAHNPRTNAFITVDASRARAAAQAVDRERASGVRRGPLHGIPISLKDLIDEAGVVTTAGSRVLRDRVAQTDAEVVVRLRRAGAVLVGRTNLHEFALGTTSDASAFGPVRHPQDPSRSPGGSSGGSAVAVAAGMSLASIGTDTGGSVRIPSAACGLVGIKPTTCDVPLDGVVPLSTSLDHVGPLARTVQDAAWVHAVLAAAEPATLAPRDPRRLRLGRLTGYFDDPIEPPVREAFEQAIEDLRRAGVQVTSTQLPNTDRIAPMYVDIVLPEAAHWHGPYLDARAGEYTRSVHDPMVQGRTISAVRYLDAQAARRALRAAVDEALADVDALVTVTLPMLAPPIGADTVPIRPDAPPIPIRGAMLKHTQPFNLSGHPAVSLPVAGAALPVGLQLIGRRGGTWPLLEIAAACERLLTR